MGRNPKRVYGYPVFDPASLVWQRLTQDAADMGVSVHALMVVRLGDYYKGRHDEVTEPIQAIPVVAPTSTIQQNALAAAQAWMDDDEDLTEPQLEAIKVR